MELRPDIPEKVIAIVKTESAKRLDLSRYKVLFFGSRVKGRNRERSDIDVGILGETALPPQVLSELQEAFEEAPTIYKIDCVDLMDVSDDFRNTVLQGPLVSAF